MSLLSGKRSPLLRKLSNFSTFDADETAAIEALASEPVPYRPREIIIEEGERPQGVNLVLSGFACRYKALPDGRRQILGYFVPGDICDLRVFVLEEMDHSIAAVTAAEVAVLPAEEIRQVTARFPRITTALWWATLVEEAISREWILNMGRRSAGERTAHLFCEIYHRLKAVELADGGRFTFPVTQQELADALGLSVVHVNRTLQLLRRRGLVDMENGTVILPNLEALEDYAMFNPRHLHLRERARPDASAPLETT
ncbi:cAMP-binding domain of CRP or a regulatory subunit of cAMP-dependent protein kinases [Chelatococcus sambhunathii]|uniref:Cyclic nucleotide-binding protein n=2 Tax=Chelatococcus TaxID=28209 RepID=A0AAC9P0G0_9HYPH|nr:MULTISPECIES: Crp/Fnr family transcriptional regulator [Chelatococcus]APF39502.1 cyclic nucleotide-binding protein [Chelatococcus daeguensis]KZE29143.1 cyclic nucleotide-binding protein [Chelatococcus daeguensis]CUA86878.1 cAMP-binding domain of CRP or a regulatory subunit of cAMP-dependent protein kinases [Chelatococcus sambhunathii]